MTRDEAVAIIKQRMGNNTDTSLDALIVTEMQFVQSTILEQAPELPWFLWDKGTSTVTNVLVESPTSFLQFDMINELMVYDTANSVFKKLSRGDYTDSKVYDGYSSGIPVGYVMREVSSNNRYQIEVFGWDGTTSYEITWPGYYADTVLSTDVENKWLRFAPDLLMAETGAIIASQYNSFQQFGALFAQQRETAKARLAAKNAEWEEMMIQRLMNGGV